MRSEFQAAALVLLLIVFAFALGVEFGGAGLNGASGAFGPPSGNGKQTTTATAPPEFVVKAVGINPQDLYMSASFGSIPPSMLVPLSGVRVTLTTQGTTPIPFRRLPSFTLTTNKSGVASASLLPGNYQVQAVGTTFTLNTGLTLTNNSTAVLNIELRPTHQAVATVRVVSPDTISGVESASRIYALISNATAPPPGLSELVGAESGFTIEPSSNSSCIGSSVCLQSGFNATVGHLVSVNATLLGSYQGTQGYWADLEPVGTYAAFPAVGVTLFQFEPIAEVIYTAG